MANIEQPCFIHRFGDALRVVQENLDAKNYYAYNPEFDIQPLPQMRNVARI